MVLQRGTSMKSKAIHITSDDDIVVYGINKEQFSADGFLAIPISSYGKVKLLYFDFLHTFISLALFVCCCTNKRRW